MANTLITAQGGAVDKIYRHDGFSSTVDNSISAPSSGPGDVAVRSNDVIVSDWDAEEKIYQLTGFTSTVRNSVAAADDSVFGVWPGLAQTVTH